MRPVRTVTLGPRQRCEVCSGGPGNPTYSRNMSSSPRPSRAAWCRLMKICTTQPGGGKGRERLRRTCSPLPFSCSERTSGSSYPTASRARAEAWDTPRYKKKCMRYLSYIMATIVTVLAKPAHPAIAAPVLGSGHSSPCVWVSTLEHSEATENTESRYDARSLTRRDPGSQVSPLLQRQLGARSQG